MPDPIPTAFGPIPLAAAPGMILTDATSHEHDIRGALGIPGHRESDGVRVVFASHVVYLGTMATIMGLPTLTVTALDPGDTWMIGRDEPTARLEGTLFELFRTTGGRRTRNEISNLGWSGDYEASEAHLVMPSYPVPETSLNE